MTNRILVTLEIGLKGKKVLAVAPDWPGLERRAKTGEGQSKGYVPLFRSPESIGRLREIAASIGLSQAETARWSGKHMIGLYDAGLRLETEMAVVRCRLKRPLSLPRHRGARQQR